jgi:hypothetical protein
MTDRKATQKLELDNEHYKNFMLKTLQDKVSVTKSVQNFNTMDHKLKEKEEERKVKNLKKQNQEMKTKLD